MNIMFLTASGLMVALALALVLWPLLRQAGRQTRRRGLIALAVLFVLGLPLASAGLYEMVGNPAALNPAAAEQPLTLDQAITKIKAQLGHDSADPNLWTLLGQAYGAKNEPALAASAFEHALKYRPDDADLLVAWAQADSLAQPQHMIVGEARARLERALAVDPTHQRGLWLLGISDFQLQHYSEAIATWTRLLKLLPPDSDVARGVAKQVELAAARGSLKLSHAQAQVLSAATAAGAPPPATAGSSAPRLIVKVSLAPQLTARLAADSVLFVYARNSSGPSIPLAVARLPASALPATVTLTDAMSMAPGMNLSSAQQVIVGARLSAQGQALAQAGDLEGSAGPVAVSRTQPISIVIDKVVRQ